MKKSLIGYQEAIQLMLSNITPLKSETVSLTECDDRVIAENLNALVNSPSVNASMKDGYAIRSSDIANATSENPVQLKINGMATAGNQGNHSVKTGNAVRILTGAKIPKGANAVVAEEFTASSKDVVTVKKHSEPGRNILPKGCDAAFNDRICSRGERLSPGKMGYLAASGHNKIPVFKKPGIAIIATGDEMVTPGCPLPEGKLFASNLITLNAWCRRYGMKTSMEIVKDQPETILKTLKQAVKTHDAILTSGGAWTGDRDFVVEILKMLGWKQIFHRVRMGPGKAVGFGLLNEKPVFVLPGGPPSNLLAFLQIALPGILKLGGYSSTTLPKVQVKLEDTITNRDIEWTQFVFGVFKKGNGHTHFRPLKLKSRLQTIAKAEGILILPEGTMKIPVGSIVSAQLLV